MKPPVFVLSTGRCGSTLVQRILNSYPDVTIWGEHAGFLRSAADQYFSLLERPGSDRYLFGNGRSTATLSPGQLAEAKAADQWQAWLNWFSPADVTQLFRDFVCSFFRPPLLDELATWGFKEVRYGCDDRVIEFLARLFPDAVFVFLVRNGFDTVTSQLMAWQPQGWLKAVRLERLIPQRRLLNYARNWATQNRTFLEWHASGRIRSFLVRFEDLVSQKPVLEPVLQAIGKTLGDEQRQIVAGTEARGSAFTDTQDVQRRSDLLGYLPLQMVEWTLGGLNAELGYETPGRVRWIDALRRVTQARGLAAPGRETT
jgi:hypothetical protein